MITHLEERPHHVSLFDLALKEHMATEAKHLIVIPNATTEVNIMKAIITETAPNAALVVAPFNVGEVIATSTPVTGASSFPHRPHGIIRVNGNVEAAIDALSPWINAEVKVEGVSWTWADSIEESLRAGESVNFDALPAGVILESPVEDSDSRLGAREEVCVPEGWTGRSLMEAVFNHRQKINTGVDRR